MRNLLLISSFLICSIVQSQIVNIPDANFKNALVNTNCVDTNSDGIGDMDADTNNDGEIQVSEAEAILWLDVTYQFIDSLEGIQNFVNLLELKCGFNWLITLDTSQSPNLRVLDCRGNIRQLTTFDVTQNPNLEVLICYDNYQLNLDVTQNPNLKILNCRGNRQTTIDVSQNHDLEILDCGGNELTTLDVTQNPNLVELDCRINQFTDLDLTQNPNLQILHCGWNDLTSLDVSQNLNLIELNCGANEIISLDVSQNINLTKLACGTNQLTSLDVSQNDNLTRLSCGANQLTTLDVSQNRNLKGLSCFFNDLNNLNIKNGNNENLEGIMASVNPNLFCIQVDDVNYAQNAPNWIKDSWAEYSELCVLGIQNIKFNDFTLTPNPTHGILNINTDYQIETIKIFSLQGELLKQTSNTNIDVSYFNSGLYFVQVSVYGKTSTKKFVKI
jgi:hypothetical protein